MTRRQWVVAIALAAQSLAGCASFHVHSDDAGPSDVWIATLSHAQQSVAAARYEEADSTLAAFATRHPGSAEAIETAYWRALFRLDPSNPHASLTTAMASLDGYLADTRPRAHVPEATVMRRVAGQLEAMNHLAANAMTQARDANATAANAKSAAASAKASAAEAASEPNSADEIKRLKDELAKANAELERIRKRLQPPPGK